MEITTPNVIMEEKSPVRLLTKLLFASDEEKKKCAKILFSDTFDLNTLLKLILQNGVFCRVYDILDVFAKDNGQNLPQSFEDISKREKKRRQSFLEGLTFIQNIFQSHEIDMVFLKVDKYPDTGKDIDIYVGNELKKAIQLLIKNGMIRKPSFYLKIFNRNILVHNNLNIPIIDLYSTFSRFHEKWIPDSDVFLLHKKEICIENIKITTTSAEDSLLVHCISSIYLNASVDLSSIWIVHKQIIEEDFDLNYFTTIVNESGISLGMYYLLYLTKEVTCDEIITYIMENMGGSSFLKRILTKRLNASSFPLFIPYSHIFLLYFHKFFLDISRKRIAHLIFLIIPFIASLILRKKGYHRINR